METVIKMEKLTRSEAREKIMTILYQINIFNNNNVEYDLTELIDNNLEVDNEFVKDIVFGVVTYQQEIDKLANQYLTDWTIDRLGNTDQAILRMAIYELLYTDTPDIVAINEAIELAKVFSDDSVRKMINGTLDKIYKNKVDNGQ